MRRIYLDHAATTPLDSAVLDAMRPYLTDHFGNPSSVHALGRKARFAVEESRETIAALIGAEPGEIIFTSGGTESDNAAIKGALAARPGRLITSAAEHEAVLRPAEAMHGKGRPLTVLTPDATGAVAPETLVQYLSDEVGLVSLMHGNNELGTITDVRGVSRLCRDRGIPFHTDAVQTAGYGLIRVDEIDVDMVSMSAHKCYGPKGVGVLYVRGGVDFEALVEGGSQERRRRGGTENVAGVVGMAAAFRRAIAAAEERRARAIALRDRLLLGLRQTMGERMIVNTPVDSVPVMPNILNVAFPPVDGEPIDGEMLLLNLDLEGVLASAGSACTSGALKPSHVLLAIGLDRDAAAAGVRFSLGKDTTEEEIDYAVDAVARVMHRMTGRTVQA